LRPLQRGLSLVETVISLFLIGMLTVLLVNLFPSSVAASRHSETRMRAEVLAESLLAQQMSRDYEQLEVGSLTSLVPIESDFGQTFYPTVEVFQAETRDVSFIKGLRVTVEWTHSEVERSVVQEVWVANLRR
jgi:type II secretory pathway pseudopilin PulG